MKTDTQLIYKDENICIKKFGWDPLTINNVDNFDNKIYINS
jgi:hypothetical protein